MKAAIITPYYKEPVAQLRQCVNSVREQSYPCTHILLPDGRPSSGLSLKGHLCNPANQQHLSSRLGLIPAL